MLVHADGIDFNLLKPKWLAIGLFVALPGLFGVLIGASVDRVARPDSWTAGGRRRWLLPLLAVGCFPLAAFVLPFALAVVVVGALAATCKWYDECAAFRPTRSPSVLRGSSSRSLGLVALINDIGAAHLTEIDLPPFQTRPLT